MGGDLGLFINPAFPSESCIIPSQLINHGPSSISQGVLELSCPQALEGQQLLYVTRVTGLSNCTSNYTPNSQGLEVRTSTWAWGGGLGPWAGKGCLEATGGGTDSTTSGRRKKTHICCIPVLWPDSLHSPGVLPGLCHLVPLRLLRPVLWPSESVCVCKHLLK